MIKLKKWIKAREFSGLPNPDDFKLEEELPELEDGGMNGDLSSFHI